MADTFSAQMIWRMRLYGAIPEALFERLLDARVGTKALIWMGRHCRKGGDPSALPPVEVERCPHCGGTLRTRNGSINEAIDVLNKWIDDGQPDSKTDA